MLASLVMHRVAVLRFRLAGVEKETAAAGRGANTCDFELLLGELPVPLSVSRPGCTLPSPFVKKNDVQPQFSTGAHLAFLCSVIELRSDDLCTLPYANTARKTC